MLRPLLLFLFLCSPVVAQSTDPFDPGQSTDPKPQEPYEPPECTEPEPEPYPEPTPPSQYTWACTYDLVVTARSTFDARDKADEACKRWGWDYCDVEKINRNKFVAEFRRPYTPRAQGYSLSNARLGVFTVVGSAIEDNEQYSPVFTHTGSFVKCFEIGSTTDDDDNNGGY